MDRTLKQGTDFELLTEKFICLFLKKWGHDRFKCAMHIKVEVYVAQTITQC